MAIFFVPLSSTFVPTFTPTLDGSAYVCQLLWNVSAQRYYLQCSDFSNNLIFLVPIVSSMAGINITSLEWDSQRQIIDGECSSPHFIPLGTVCNRTILNAVPDSYNGSFQVLSTGPTTFSYNFETNPNPAATPFGTFIAATSGGSLNHLVSMSAGFFESAIVYRNSQFEVLP